MARTTSLRPLTWAEGRRRRAWELHQQGWSNVRIAEALGVSAAAVGPWVTRAKQQGLAALAPRRRLGQGARLTPEQEQHLLVLWEQGPEVHGFFGPFWTSRRVAIVLTRAFAVTYSPNHVRKVLHRLKWSFPKATVRARQRDEAAIHTWVQRTWPAIRQRAKNEGRTLVFVDEAAFYMTPSRRFTWAPRGQPPEYRAMLTHDHLSVISAVTYDGRLYLLSHHGSIKTLEVIAFLRHLLHWIPGPMLILWDGGRIHNGKELHEFLRLDSQRRVTFERFPPYAPEVDPDEYVWRQLKYTELVNRTCWTLDQLQIRLVEATRRLRCRVALLRRMVDHAGLK